jgi:predicted DNA-binding ribbon-helix-helix protein
MRRNTLKSGSVESSFWSALRGIARSQNASLLVIPQIDPGQFLLFLFDGIHT